jgi:hypothetical protein
MGTPYNKPADDGGPLYPVRVRDMFGDSLVWVPKSQVSWYKEHEQSRPTSAPGLWDGH